MPYINPNGREETEIEGPFEPGDLAYILWLDVLHWMTEGQPAVAARQTGKTAWNYTNMSQVVGVLETVKLEFVRRFLEGYEDEKIQDNGDVMGPQTKRYGHDQTES